MGVSECAIRRQASEHELKPRVSFLLFFQRSRQDCEHHLASCRRILKVLRAHSSNIGSLQDAFFRVEESAREYRVESNHNNEINLEVSTDLVLRALRSAANSTDVTMRLAKDGANTKLSFQIVTNVSHLSISLALLFADGSAPYN